MCVCVCVCCVYVCMCVCGTGEGVGGETSAEVELVKRFKEVIRSILQYVKARHAQGISWNPGGSVLKSFP